MYFFSLATDVKMFGATDILTRENLRHMDKILTNKDGGWAGKNVHVNDIVDSYGIQLDSA